MESLNVMNEVRETEEKKSKRNKGFSLVELIIVIAIMAILIGIIGSQVIPYMEKSRVSKDMTTLDTCYTSLQTVIAEKAPATFAATALDSLSADIKSELTKLIGNGVTSNATLSSKLGSKGAKGQTVTFEYNEASGLIRVQAGTLYVSNQGSGEVVSPAPTVSP